MPETPKTIALNFAEMVVKEAVAAAGITPGMLVELVPAATTVRVHATAGGNATPAFALENDLIGDGIDDAYIAGDTVKYAVFSPGANINAILADGETTAVGDKLVSDGAGALEVLVATNTDDTDIDIQTQEIVATALEIVAASGSTERIRVEAV